MAHNHQNHRGWTDLNQERFGFPPVKLFTAAELAIQPRASVALNEDADIFVPGYERKVIYEDDDGNKFHWTLTLFEMPSGAANITLYSSSTSQIRGRAMKSTGVLSAANDTQDDTVGFLFDHYYSACIDNDDDDMIVTTLSEGDRIWLITKGKYQANSGAAWTAGDNLVVASSGRLTPALALTAGGVTAAEFTDNDFTAKGQALAVARETAAGASEFKYIDVRLITRFRA